MNRKVGEGGKAREEFVKVVDAGASSKIHDRLFVGGFLSKQMGEKKELLGGRAKDVSNVQSM